MKTTQLNSSSAPAAAGPNQTGPSRKMPVPGSRLALVAAIALAAAFPPSARADFLFWADALLQTNSVKTGHSFADSALRSQGATGIRVLPGEVAGSVGRNYVAIHCVGTAPKVTAMIMVVGPDGAEVARVRDAVRKKITGTVRFD